MNLPRIRFGDGSRNAAPRNRLGNLEGDVSRRLVEDLISYSFVLYVSCDSILVETSSRSHRVTGTNRSIHSSRVLVGSLVEKDFESG